MLLFFCIQHVLFVCQIKEKYNTSIKTNKRENAVKLSTVNWQAKGDKNFLGIKV